MIALTGTPGTGKSSIAKVLKEKYGLKIYDVDKIGREEYSLEYDPERECWIVNVERLREYVASLEGEEVVLVGLLSHLLDPEIVIVLRTHPRELEFRLRKKGWNLRKIRENLEAEALGVITAEAMEKCKEVYEVDTTGKSPEESAKEVYQIILKRPKDYRAPRIDYTEAILEWY